MSAGLWGLTSLISGGKGWATKNKRLDGVSSQGDKGEWREQPRLLLFKKPKQCQYTKDNRSLHSPKTTRPLRLVTSSTCAPERLLMLWRCSQQMRYQRCIAFGAEAARYNRKKSTTCYKITTTLHLYLGPATGPYTSPAVRSMISRSGPSSRVKA